VIIGLAFLAASVSLLEETLASAVQPTRAVVWGGFALATYAGGLLCLVGAKQRSGLGLTSWKLGSWTLLWYGATFGVATVSWSQPQTGTSAEIAVSSVMKALWLVTVGISFWALGYTVGSGRFVRGLAARALAGLGRRCGPSVRSLATPWILYGIGLAARLGAAVTSGRFGYVGDASAAVSTATGYGQVLSVISLCAPLAVAAAALQVFIERLRTARITLIILFSAELVFGALAGGKQNFVIAVLAVVIPFCAARHRLPKVALIAVIFIFLGVVVPFNIAYRSTARASSGTLTTVQAVSAAPDILRETVAGRGVYSELSTSADFLLQRIQEIDSPAIILQRTPSQIAFSSPVQLVDAPVAALVPRAIWPSKPILDTGYQFSQDYYELPSTIYTSSSITPVGDLYRHGGWLPVMVGMLLLGSMVRLLDDVLDVRANPHAIFLVLLLFPSLVKGEQDWVTLLAGIPATVLIWVFSVRLTFCARSAP
jgi:hypothetical protein